MHKLTAIKLEDPGNVCIAGYSAGQINAPPSFDWAKNILSRRMTPGDLHTLVYKLSSAFALFWNMAKAHIPNDIGQYFTDFFDSLGMHHMDANQSR